MLLPAQSLHLSLCQWCSQRPLLPQSLHAGEEPVQRLRRRQHLRAPEAEETVKKSVLADAASACTRDRGARAKTAAAAASANTSGRGTCAKTALAQCFWQASDSACTTVLTVNLSTHKNDASRGFFVVMSTTNLKMIWKQITNKQMYLI